MGKARYVYFSDELIERLEKEPNTSKLICDLLIKHYQEKQFEGLSKAELERELEIIKIQKKAEKAIKELRNGVRRT